MLNASPQLAVIVAALSSYQGKCLVSEWLTVRQLAEATSNNTQIKKSHMRKMQRIVGQLCPSDICDVYTPQDRDTHIKKYKFKVCAR